MVIFFEWHRTAMDQKCSSGLPVTGEDTGLGALASPLAGYLGKVHERAASLEDCPWCASKGLSYALRSYRINLQESITLCTNPQCLFPLVSRSLEDILSSLNPVESTTGNKRKKSLALETEELINHSPKRLRSSEPDSSGAQSVDDTPVCQAQQCAVNTVRNGHHVTPKTDGEKVNGYHLDFACPAAGTTEWESLQEVDAAEPENTACTEDFSPTHLASAGHLQSSSKGLLTSDVNQPEFASHCGAIGVLEVQDDSSQVKSHAGVLNRPTDSILTLNLTDFANKDVYSDEINTSLPPLTEQTARTETKDLSCILLSESDELVSVPDQFFWRNSDNLCWLDSLLTALVNCKSLRKSKPKDEPQQSSVWQMMKEYEDICAAIQAHQQTGTDGITRVPNHVLQKANADLQDLRMSVFKLLQPKLHCKLGKRETPVFAMPLLLKLDSWVEPLFQSTFHWEFKCSECKTTTKERVMKTLPTFTKIIPEWRPLHAVHLATCNVCRKKKQRRTMILERVPPVFVLHFVEGLPDDDVRIYTFSFKGKRYSVTTVIQYNHQLKHFVTWTRNSDGSWLEYDDLKHPDCKTHQKLPVPAQEMHVVFWEMEDDKYPPACSPSSTCTDPPQSQNEINPSLTENALIDELLACTPDQSVVTSHNDTDIVCAFSVSEGNSVDTTITAGVDTSIGSTTLLDAFEGLSHNDIVTLTLVELKADSETQPLKDGRETQDLILKNTEMLDSTPDSSSALMGNEMSQSSDIELAATSNSSDNQNSDGSSSDPTFVPCGRRGRGRGNTKGKTVGKQKNKKAASAKAAPQISPPAASEPSNVIFKKPVCGTMQHSTPPVDTTQQTSSVSSTETLSLSTSQVNPTKPIPLDQNARWSFLLSKHPVTHVRKSIAEVPPSHTPTLAMQVKPSPPSHSTPNPVRRQQTPGIPFPKPQLRTEGSVGLPLKAAEMYGAFGAKSSSTQSQLTSPAPLSGSATFLHQKSLMNTTVLSGTSLPAREAKGLSEISSLKKASSQSSKVPPGVSKTEALRHKLIKKLKAKKKALAKLNQLLGDIGETSRPDSTDLRSPNTVTSSTYDGSACEDFLSDLLSPATTASNLSPDSSGLLDKLASTQDPVDQLDCSINAAGMLSQTDTCMAGLSPENFLDEFLSQAIAERPSEIETEALSALEIFM